MVYESLLITTSIIFTLSVLLVKTLRNTQFPFSNQFTLPSAVVVFWFPYKRFNNRFKHFPKSWHQENWSIVLQVLVPFLKNCICYNAIQRNDLTDSVDGPSASTISITISFKTLLQGHWNVKWQLYGSVYVWNEVFYIPLLFKYSFRDGKESLHLKTKKRLTGIVRVCFFEAGRSIAHKCARFLALCIRSAKICLFLIETCFPTQINYTFI